MNKYRIISLEPLQPAINRNSIQKLPQGRPRTLSLRCPTTTLQLQSIPVTNPVAAE
jgi:hypothetical protein